MLGVMGDGVGVIDDGVGTGDGGVGGEGEGSKVRTVSKANRGNTYLRTRLMCSYILSFAT